MVNRTSFAGVTAAVGDVMGTGGVADATYVFLTERSTDGLPHTVTAFDAVHDVDVRSGRCSPKTFFPPIISLIPVHDQAGFDGFSRISHVTTGHAPPRCPNSPSYRQHATVGFDDEDDDTFGQLPHVLGGANHGPDKKGFDAHSVWGM